MEACAGPLRLVELDGDRLEVLRGNSVLITRGRVAEDLLDALRRAGCPRSFGPPPARLLAPQGPSPGPRRCHRDPSGRMASGWCASVFTSHGRLREAASLCTWRWRSADSAELKSEMSTKVWRPRARRSEPSSRPSWRGTRASSATSGPHLMTFISHSLVGITSVWHARDE